MLGFSYVNRQRLEAATVPQVPEGLEAIPIYIRWWNNNKRCKTRDAANQQQRGLHSRQHSPMG